MSLQEIQELRQRLEEERRLLEEEQRLREQAEEQLRHQTRDTTLPEFLDAGHVHLFLGLAIEKDKDSSTNPANADHKLRPATIREWTNFPIEQTSIWEDLMNVEFANEPHFTPLLALKEYGKEVERMVSSELDLSYFQQQTVESRVASVVRQLHANSQLRQTFCLNGNVIFENHANTLTDESSIAADMSSLSLTQREPVAAKSGNADISVQPPGRNRKTSQPRNSRPRADQFCVYNKSPCSRAGW